MFEVWSTLDISLPLSEVAARARRVEALGYDGLAIPDLVHDGIAAAALAIAATERIQIATHALIAFPRSPMVVAVAAWDLQDASRGRFQLGLGAQVRGNIVERFSTEWTPPAPRVREYIGALRAIFECWQQRTPLQFEGEHYRFSRMQPYTRPPPIEHPAIPIRLAAVGRHMTALAGELADGLNTHPTQTSPRCIREHIDPQLARGAARSGRDPADVSRWINPLCASGHSAAEVREQREQQRRLLATLFSTPSYWPSLELHGWLERGERLHQLVRAERWNELAPLVDDEMLDTLVPTATYRELPELLIAWYAGIAEAISFPLPADPRHDREIARAIAALRGTR
jgi:probable F420-dependent oxidoreductase